MDSLLLGCTTNDRCTMGIEELYSSSILVLSLQDLKLKWLWMEITSIYINPWMEDYFSEVLKWICENCIHTMVGMFNDHIRWQPVNYCQCEKQSIALISYVSDESHGHPYVLYCLFNRNYLLACSSDWYHNNWHSWTKEWKNTILLSIAFCLSDAFITLYSVWFNPLHSSFWLVRNNHASQGGTR